MEAPGLVAEPLCRHASYNPTWDLRNLRWSEVGDSCSEISCPAVAEDQFRKPQRARKRREGDAPERI